MKKFINTYYIEICFTSVIMALLCVVGGLLYGMYYDYEFPAGFVVMSIFFFIITFTMLGKLIYHTYWLGRSLKALEELNEYLDLCLRVTKKIKKFAEEETLKNKQIDALNDEIDK